MLDGSSGVLPSISGLRFPPGLSGMSSHFRTWQQHHVGRVLITVELEPAAGEFSVERHRGLAELSERMVQLFTGLRLGATWAVAEPARSKACATIIRAGGDHEIAIQGNSEWIGPDGRPHEVCPRVGLSCRPSPHAGIQVTSLVLRAAMIQEHVDLVLKQGISAVAGVTQECRPRLQQATPKALRYGVWELPASERLPLAASWLSSGRRALLRRMWSAVRERFNVPSRH